MEAFRRDTEALPTGDPVPFYSTVSAFFCLSLVSAIAVFAGLGLEGLAWQLGRLRILLYANLIGLYASILYLFALA